MSEAMLDTAENLLNLSEEFVLSQAKAKKYSIEIAELCGITTDSINFEDEISLGNGRRTSAKIEFSTIRKTGAGGAIQEVYDAKNALFKLSLIDLGFSIHGAAGLEVTVSSEKPAEMAGRPSKSSAHFHPLKQLSQDILKMREACVQNSVSARECLPFYSAYLVLCVSIVDCFINYCATYFLDGSEDNQRSVSNYVAELFSKSTRQDRKLEVLWNSVFLNHNMEKNEYQTVLAGFVFEEIVDSRLMAGFNQLKSRNIWCDYTALKDARNQIVHPNNHIDKIYIEDIKVNLNRCRGLGELLLSFSRHQSRFGELGCLRHLAHAPEVDFTAN